MNFTTLCQGALALAIITSLDAGAHAQEAAPADSGQTAELPKVLVKDRAYWESRPKLQYLMREVDGPFITVTKKTSITKVDNIPTVVDNHLRELFAQTPGLFYSEQQTPGQVNLSYRGIGNPQESEFVTVMLDGIPLMADWIGYPTIYTFPLPQQLAEVQLIRGGSSLLYGPEPPPVVNLVSRAPVKDRAFAGYTENVVGSNGLLATFNQVSGTSGDWEYLADAHYRTSDGQRENGDSRLRGTDLHLGYRPSEESYTALDLRVSRLDSGDPGRMSYTQFLADEDFSPSQVNRVWTDRYVLSLTHKQDFDENNQVVAKLWGGYQDNASRSNGVVQDDQFRFGGLDARLLHRWGRGNALTIGTTAYHSDAPFRQWTSGQAAPDRYVRFGRPCENAGDKACTRLRQDRSTDYVSVFAENVFRFRNGWHVVPSLRLDREHVDIDESVRPPNLTRGLVKRDVTHNVPLFGLGAGNDFGRENETYFNVSQGWRPVRYFDIGSPFGNTHAGSINNPDPTKVLSFEAGVHGTPRDGLFYDVSLFQVNVKDRIEAKQIEGEKPGNTINTNTGNTRHRGFEGQVSYDFLAARDPQSRQHLALFANLSLLDAEFTATHNPAVKVGNTPAFSPKTLARVGVTWREDEHYKLALSAVSVASQYYQDSNVGAATPGAPNYLPAKVPSYTVADFSADWWVIPHVRLLGGVSNLADRKYYARVFGGGLEPGLGRTFYAGASYEF